MEDESHYDHEGEEGIERKGNCIVWRAKIGNGRVPDDTVWLRSLVVDYCDTRCCTSELVVSIDIGLQYLPKEARNMRHGKAMTQQFIA